MLLIPILAAAQLVGLAAGSRVWIEGDSNLHQWSCKATQPDARIEIDPDAAQIARSLSLRVQVSGLDCGDGKMNDKLRDALKAEQHPVIEYHLIRADRVTAQPLQLKATGALTIAGRTRTVAFTVDVEMGKGGVGKASGRVPILMTDYGVEPPTALLVLKTYDQIVVHFEISTIALAAQASLP
jgi:polyisoprenoid-binding protein YceI